MQQMCKCPECGMTTNDRQVLKTHLFYSGKLCRTGRRHRLNKEQNANLEIISREYMREDDTWHTITVDVDSENNVIYKNHKTGEIIDVENGNINEFSDKPLQVLKA